MRKKNVTSDYTLISLVLAKAKVIPKQVRSFVMSHYANAHYRGH